MADGRELITDNRELITDNRELITALRLVRLDADWPAIAQEPTTRPASGVKPANLAYVIYTSGSTGAPKGVLIEQRSLVNHAIALTTAYGIGPADRMLQFVTISFDAAAEEIFPALISGATLVLIRAATDLLGAQLFAFCEREQITLLHLPASVWHQSVDELVGRNLSVAAPLKTLLVGGESLDVERLKQWARLVARPIKLLNAYGPTEATITTTLYETTCEPETLAHLFTVPIGRPIANTQVYVLDAQRQPVPVGVTGELYIGGGGVARGYLNRPELTAERFVPNPLTKAEGGRWKDEASSLILHSSSLLYRTGDLVRYRPDGNLEFVGRADDQVKIRGFRVELGEVEAALTRHPAVRDVVVLARDDGQQSPITLGMPGAKRLVAYVVADEGGLTVSQLAADLRQKLPEYMIPSAFVMLPQMPLLPNGKVDRHALASEPRYFGAEGGERPELEDTYVAPRTPLERHLATLWQELLGINKVGVHDNFFVLGGNSILGATFVNRLQEQLGEYVYLIALFDAPTIAELATYLHENYPLGVGRLLGSPVTSAGVTPAPAGAGIAQPAGWQMGEAEIEQLRQLVRPLPPRAEAAETKNPPAAFILSAPRSGSTLLRVMLGGHSRLFAPPELQLLNYNTLADQHAAFASERDSFWLDGEIRALMAIHDCNADEARRILAECLAAGLTTKQFYRRMQEWLAKSRYFGAKSRYFGNDTIFVDKTPNYALDLDVLRRAESDFQDARYIHLIRHPYAMIPSFEKAKLHVFYPPFFRGTPPFSPRELAELIWVISQRNILAFLAQVPPERQQRVYYEDLVRRPREVMEGICRFLGLSYEQGMVEPYADARKRMTDSIHPLSRMVGDVRFHEHTTIDPDSAERWKEHLTEDYLGESTWALAEQLGYPRWQPAPRPAAVSKLPGRTLPKALVPIQPRGKKPPLFCIHPAGGVVFPYYSLMPYLGKDQPLYGIQDPGVHDSRIAFATVEEMARHYVEAVRVVQPQGPYHIIGWSSGGVVAYEMAQQFHREGQRVVLLAMLDTGAPAVTRKARRRADEQRSPVTSGQTPRPRIIKVGSLKAGLRALFSTIANVLPYIRDGLFLVIASAWQRGNRGAPKVSAMDYLRWSWFDLSRSRFLGRADVANVVAQDTRLLSVQLPSVRRILSLIAVHGRMARRYVPEPYPGRVTVFKASDSLRATDQERNAALGWDLLAEGGVDVRPVSGNHITLLTPPYVEGFAQVLRTCLEEAREEVRQAFPET
jgi:amino acid adenylation domain-containing protein